MWLSTLLLVACCAHIAWTYPGGSPLSRCFNGLPIHGQNSPQVTPSPYNISVNNLNYTKGSNLTVTIDGGDFKGFILQARPLNTSGTPWPVGSFTAKPSGSRYMYCSGGVLENTVTHDNNNIKSSIQLTWKAPSSVSYGDIQFWATVATNVSTFWTGIKSGVVSGPPADFPALVAGPNFSGFETSECGKTKGCFLMPSDCTSSSTCDYLLTYAVSGGNLTIEMSAKNTWVAVGFNSKKLMDGMDSIMCSTLESSAVQQRHQRSVKHDPRRPIDLAGTNDQILNAAAYENGVVKCRVTRKMTPSVGSMKDLTKKLYLLFSHGKTSSTGVASYHHQARYTTQETVDVSKPEVLGVSSGNGGSSNEITEDGCGKTKTCFSVPEACTSSSDCDYLVTYKATADDIEFELASKSSKWVAIGFNDDAEMPDTDALICMSAGGNVAVEHFRADKGKSAPTKTQPTPSITLSLSAEQGSGVLCRFSRKKIATGMADLSKKWYLIFARGPVSGSDISTHVWRGTSEEQVDVSIVQEISSSSSSAGLIKAHGFLMIMAWAGLATVAIFMARYMKLVWPDEKLCGKPLWFAMHRLLMACVVTLTVIALILIFVHVKGWSSDAGAHPYIGIIVCAFAVIQPIMALFRPHPGTPKRWIFTWAHRTVGLLALVGSVVTIFLGVLLPHLDLGKKGVYVMIVYCVAILAALILEISIATRKPEAEEQASYNLASQQAAVEVKMRPPSLSFQDREIRKLVFGFIVLLVVVVILALTILINLATHDH